MDVFDYECGPKCHSRKHASELNSVITRYSLPEIQAYFQLCHSAGHQADLDGRTALHMATVCGKFDVVEWLLKEKKVDINAVDGESKWTALHKAIFYGHIAIARFLIQNSALLTLLDHDRLQALELLQMNRSNSFKYSLEDPNELFLWGENLNSTLGHSSEQRRLIPASADTFRRQKLSIRQVVLCKYHTVFLTQCGSVYTCGHGQGGRLGLGNENTYLIPEKIESLKSERCVQIAASINHTVILTEKMCVFHGNSIDKTLKHGLSIKCKSFCRFAERGTVYTCGLNDHQQLVQFPSPTQCLTPKSISLKNLKQIKGICVSRYHTVIYSEKILFAFGFNGGQLGFPKYEKYQVQLRPAPLFDKIASKHSYLIKQVTCSDAATVCLTKNGYILVLHEFQCRKITSGCWFKQVSVTGGNLDVSSEVCSSPTSTSAKMSSFTAGSYSQLVIMAVTEDWEVSIWRSFDPILRCCLFNIRNIYVTEICMSDAKFGLVVRDGRAFIGSWENTKIIKKKNVTKDDENPFIVLSKKRTIEKEEIELYRLPYIHRAISMSINRQGNNFAVTQGNPFQGINMSPETKTTQMTLNFKELMDGHLYDVQIKCGERTFPAHQYVLASHSNYLKKMLLEKKRTPNPVISIGYIHDDIVKQLFQFFYTDTCDLLWRQTEFVWTTQQKRYIDFDFFMKPTSSGNDSANVIKSESSTSSEEHSIENSTLCNDPVSLLLLIANKLEIVRLSHMLKNKKSSRDMKKHSIQLTIVPKLQFDRLKLCEFSDVTLEAEDGTEFKCHRCILIIRSEYFFSMLTNDWLEASTKKPIKFAFPADILSFLMEYLYENEVPSLFVNKTLALFCEVLIMADQLLLTELKDMVEKEIITLINLKNVCEILEFAFVYNANQLKKTCLQIIYDNLALLLESRMLDMVSDEVIRELEKFYRKKVDKMSRRLVTPFSSGPEDNYIKSLTTYLRSKKQKNLKPDSVCKQKFSKRRPRVKTKSISEEDCIHTDSTSSPVGNCVDEADKKTIITAEDVHKRKKDDSITQKVYCLSVNSPQTKKRDKNNPWNRMLPVKTEDTMVSTQSSFNVLSPSKIVNLADIMATEQNNLSRLTPPKHQSNFQYKKPAKKSILKTPSVSENKSPTATLSSSQNPWLKTNMKQENISIQPNFSDIMQDELNKMKTSNKIQKKPLKYIQMEEKAIEELLGHYAANCSFEEKITVKRDTLVIGEQLIWGKKEKFAF